MATINFGRNAGLYSEAPLSGGTRRPTEEEEWLAQNPNLSDVFNGVVAGNKVYPVSRNDAASKYHMSAKAPSENIGINSEAMDFQMPYRATFMNGLPESREEYMSALAHGMNSNDDSASNARYQKLSERREELKKQIAQISADIAYQEKLRAIEMKNDPMWDIAKQQYILKGDSSGLENIMSRMEAERGRKVTENTAKINKAAEDKSKKDAAMESYERQKEVYNYLKSKVAKLASDDPSRPEAVDNLKSAEITLKYAARRAGMEDEFKELSRVEEANLAEKTAKLSMFFRSAGVDSPESFKSLYESADDEQKRRMLDDAKLLGLSDKDLGVTGAAAKDELKQEQKKKQDEKIKAAKKKKNDFKNANTNKTFEMNGLTGKPLNEQEWVDFQKKAKEDGWTGLKLQTNGTILWL